MSSKIIEAGFGTQFYVRLCFPAVEVIQGYVTVRGPRYNGANQGFITIQQIESFSIVVSVKPFHGKIEQVTDVSPWV